MIVNWNLPNMMNGYAPQGNGSQQKFTFLPGNNEIPDADWEQIKKHPLLKHYIEEGTLTEVLKGAKDGLKSCSVPEATKIIKATYDKLLLKKWSDGETRAEVKSKITAQLAMIEEKTKKVESTESDEDDDE